MRDVLSDLLSARSRGASCVLVTVVGATGSVQREPGAAMVVLPDGEVRGSVSAGCVEAAVLDVATEVARSGDAVVVTYGADDQGRLHPLDVPLTCGGRVALLVEAVSAHTWPDLDAVVADLDAGRPVVVVTALPAPDGTGRRAPHLVVRPDGVTGSLGDPRLDAVAHTSALRALGDETVGREQVDGADLLVSAYAPPPRLVVLGSGGVASAVAAHGTLLGYAVTVCEPRPAFAGRARVLPGVDVVVDRPARWWRGEVEADRVDARTVLCVLTHDPKLDLPLLDAALRAPDGRRPGYVGAMGSRRAHAERIEALRAGGLGDAALARLSGPLGLDLGARTPAETAVSILAEVVADRRGGSGLRLSTTEGPIHRGA